MDDDKFNKWYAKVSLQDKIAELILEYNEKTDKKLRSITFSYYNNNESVGVTVI